MAIEKGKKNYMIYLIISVLLGGFGQVLLKKGMGVIGPMELNFSEFGNIVWSLISNFYIVGGLLTYGVSTLLWLTALSKLDLSFAYPFVSIGYVIMILASWLLFRENISLLRLVGCSVVLLGVIIVARS